MGIHILYHLLSKNDSKIVALYRNEAKKQDVLKTFSFYTDKPQELFDRIIWRKGDIKDVSTLAPVFENITKIYHCAAYVSTEKKHYERYFETNVSGTANIVNFALENKVEKLVHVSSIAALGLNKNGLTSEKDTTTPEDLKNYYSKTKYYGELEVWRAIEEGLNAVIVSPSVILAPYLLSKKFKRVFNYISRKGIKHYTCGQKGYVDVNDVAKIMIELMESDLTKQNYLLNSENLNFKQLFDAIMLAMNKPATKKEISYGKMNFIRKTLKIISLGFVNINKLILHYAVSTEAYSNDKIKSALNYNFQPITKSVENIVKIYQKEVEK